jgi:hypothetical protein
MRPFVLLAAFATVAVAPAFADNLLTNGSFETGDFTGWGLYGNTGFTGVTNNFDGVNPEDGNYQAYFGAVGSTGTLTQTFSDVVGASYELSYYLFNFGGTPSSFSEDVDGAVGYSVTNPGSFGYTEFTTTFTGTGSDTVNFTIQQNPSYFLLDNVSVSSTSVTPEPSSLALLGTGILSLAGAARRKFRKS